MITVNDFIAPTDNVVARKVGDEMVLLDLETGQYFGLDTVGARVWELLEQEPQTIAAICATVYAEYEAPISQIEADLSALAGQLAEKKLVVLRSN